MSIYSPTGEYVKPLNSEAHRWRQYPCSSLIFPRDLISVCLSDFWGMWAEKIQVCQQWEKKLGVLKQNKGKGRMFETTTLNDIFGIGIIVL